MKCDQCGKPAFYKYYHGPFLCVDCNVKVEQAEQMQFAHEAAMLNQLALDNSVTDAINTGQIRNLNVALDNVKNAGSHELANALQQLTEAVLASAELSPEKKKLAFNHLSNITGQAALPKDKCQSRIGRKILEGFEHVISVSPVLLGIWDTVQPLVETIF
jgi:uncharacterized Zn finger protein (UPF0148 family)